MASRALRLLLLAAGGGVGAATGVYGVDRWHHEQEEARAAAAVNAARRERVALETQYAASEQRLAHLNAERGKAAAELAAAEKAVHEQETKLRNAVDSWQSKLAALHGQEAAVDEEMAIAARHMDLLGSHLTHLQRLSVDAEQAAAQAQKAREAFPLVPRW